MHKSCLLTFALLAISTSLLAAPVDRDTKVRNDKQNVLEAGFWIYDDLAKGIELAKKTKKPLLVIIRCIPCEACEGFDAKVVDRDPEINTLLDKFVCVRIVKGNGLDLSLFQYDYDLSFAAFYMNADKTIYGRFGTRASKADPASEITMAGFRKALTAAVELHKNYPLNKERFVGKAGSPVKYAVPEEHPLLKPKYKGTLDYDGKVAQSCIHCHQIRDAQRREIREAKQPLPDEVLFPYPMPDVLGFKLDPGELATVKTITPNSVAAKAGLQTGDKITSLAGQPILSIADAQWVLHTAKAPTKLAAVIERGGKEMKLELPLAADWRRGDDISWRPTSWELRRMATGGAVLESLSAEDRAKLKLADDKLALRIKYLGQYNDHAAAKNAGFMVGDVLIEYNGSTEPLTESKLFEKSMNEHRIGDRVACVVLRDGKKVELKLPMQ